jgi:hypothetical protein
MSNEELTPEQLAAKARGPEDEGEPLIRPPQEQSLTDIESKLAELRAERDAAINRATRAEAEADKFRPTHDIRHMLEDPVGSMTKVLGERYWLDAADRELAAENKARHRQMLPMLEWTDTQREQKVAELQAKEGNRFNRPVTSPPSKRLKMYFERNGVPTIEQIPLEPQVNNGAGSLADPVVRYTDKGFKLTDPFLCMRAGCFAPAAVDSNNRWGFDGYCTALHRSEVEGEKPQQLPGVVTSGVAGAYAAR